MLRIAQVQRRLHLRSLRLWAGKHHPDQDGGSFLFGEKMEVRKFVSPDNSEVRTAMIDGGPWFSAGDLCVALGISDMRQAVERLDDDERGVFTVPTPGGDQSIRAVSESGMYSLVLTSRKPEAKIFKKWVTAEVLPAMISEIDRLNAALKRSHERSKVQFTAQQVGKTKLLLAQIEDFIDSCRALEKSFGINAC